MTNILFFRWFISHNNRYTVGQTLQLTVNKELSYTMAILIQYANGVPGVKFVLDKSEITIGRGLDNDISIDDEFVSKRHAVIQLLEDELTSHVNCILIDSGSTNHTYVNNAAITAHCLSEQDKIFIGQNEFRFLSESVLSAELGRSKNSFFDDDAPGLMHASAMAGLSEEKFSEEQFGLENSDSDRVIRADLTTTRIDKHTNPDIGIPLDGYDVNEISDTQCQQMHFAAEPELPDTGLAVTSQANILEKSDDITKKRFSRRFLRR